MLNSISAVYDYMINGDKATLVSPYVAPVHGALEEVEELASSYGICLNSNRPLLQVKVVLYRYSGATGICQYPLLRSKVENNLASSRSLRLLPWPH